MMRRISGRVDWLSRRLAPRISQWHANQQRKSGLSPQTIRAQQLDMLRRYYSHLRHLESHLPPPVSDLPTPESRSPRLGSDSSRNGSLSSQNGLLAHHVGVGKDPLIQEGDRVDPVGFTVVVLDAGTGAADLRESLGSVLIQTHPQWRVTVVESVDSETFGISEKFADLWPTRWLAAPTSDDIELAETLNSLTAGSPDYLVVLDSRDRLLPHALSEFSRAIRMAERTDGSRPSVLYGDEIRRSGAAQDPVLKPAWSPLLQLTTNYADGVVAIQAAAAESAAGFWGSARSEAPDEFVGSSRSEIIYDFLSRSSKDTVPVHVPHPLLLRRSPAHRPSARAVDEACRRAGIAADVRGGPEGAVTVDFSPPDPAPTVSLVILNRDAPELISACIQSLERCTYPELEIVIVDNGSEDPLTLRRYEGWSDDWRISVVSSPGQFNYARLNNVGVAASSGQFVVLLNNDTEVLSPDWLEQMVGIAQFDGVGIVGAQLTYPNTKIQHAGLVGLAELGTGHQFVGRDPGFRAPLDLIDQPHEVLAVTGACLLISRALYDELDGLSEEFLPNDSGDVDLCLRARRVGQMTAYQPRAVLLHHESPSRKRSFENLERFALLRRWPDELLNDPYLNPNLQKGTRYQVNSDFPIPIVPLDLLRDWCRSGRIEWS